MQAQDSGQLESLLRETEGELNRTREQLRESREQGTLLEVAREQLDMQLRESNEKLAREQVAKEQVVPANVEGGEELLEARERLVEAASEQEVRTEGCRDN